VVLILLIEGAYYYGVPKIILRYLRGYQYGWQSKSVRAPKEEDVIERVVRKEGVFTYIEYTVGDGSRETQKIIKGVVEKIDGDELTILVDNEEEIKVKYKDINREIWIVTNRAGVEMGKLEQILPGDRIKLSGISEGNGVDFTVEYLIVER